IDESGDRQEDKSVKRPFRTRTGYCVLGRLNDFVQSDNGNQRSRFQDHLPVIADTRESESHHLRKQDAFENLRAWPSVSFSVFELSRGYGQKCSTESLGEIRSVNETEDTDTRKEGINVELWLAKRVGDPVRKVLETIKKQKH